MEVGAKKEALKKHMRDSAEAKSLASFSPENFAESEGR